MPKAKQALVYNFGPHKVADFKAVLARVSKCDLEEAYSEWIDHISGRISFGDAAWTIFYIDETEGIFDDMEEEGLLKKNAWKRVKELIGDAQYFYVEG